MSLWFYAFVIKSLFTCVQVKEVESIAQKYQVPGGLENPYTTLTASVSFFELLV